MVLNSKYVVSQIWKMDDFKFAHIWLTFVPSPVFMYLCSCIAPEEADVGSQEEMRRIGLEYICNSFLNLLNPFIDMEMEKVG